MELKSKIADRGRGLYLYGTVPPRADVGQAVMEEIAGKLAARLSGVELDAINVYDVQEEGDRGQGERPFPYIRTRDPREYARLLKALTGTEAICYKSVVQHPRDGFDAWLAETRDRFGICYLNLVGASASSAAYPGPTLFEACRMARFKGFVFGGVTIAERHAEKADEDERLVRKAREGMLFFTSQVVYQPEPTIWLLDDYRRKCQELGVAPARVVLTFAPCGRPKTLQFLKWLGVNFPPDTERQIFSSPSPLVKSIEVCCVNLRRILDSLRDRSIPLGINVESVSIYRSEIDASVVLYHELRSILRSFY